MDLSNNIGMSGMTEDLTIPIHADKMLVKLQSEVLKCIALIYCLIALSVSVNAQQTGLQGLKVSDDITLAMPDTIHIFHVTSVRQNARTGKNYYWFGNGVLQHTNSNYSGKLLNGDYEKFDRNKSLVEKGVFKDGLKTGLWQSWYPNGNLLAVHEWRNGVRDGKFTEYYENGVVLRNGKYANNTLTGEVIVRSYDGEILFKERFRNGKLITKKSSEKKRVREDEQVVQTDSSKQDRKSKRVKNKKAKTAQPEATEVSQPPSLDTAREAIPDKPKRRKRKSKDADLPANDNE